MGTADELMGLAAGLRRVVRQRLRAELPGPALRGAQLELLQLVEAEPGVGVAAAARSLHLAGNTVSTLVNQLVVAGMVASVCCFAIWKIQSPVDEQPLNEFSEVSPVLRRPPSAWEGIE